MQTEYILWGKTCNRNLKRRGFGNILPCKTNRCIIVHRADHFQSSNKSEFGVPNLQKGIINRKPANIKKGLWEIKIKHGMFPWSRPPCHRSLTCGMVRTRVLICWHWQVPLATIHHMNHMASYPFCHFFALIFATLGSPFLHPSCLSHTQPIPISLPR